MVAAGPRSRPRCHSVPMIDPIWHDAFVGLGVFAAVLVFWAEAKRRESGADQRIWIVVFGAVLGGAIMMRLGTWMQHLDLSENASLVEQWLYGNRSILSGLVGAYFGAHIAKRIIGYRQRTGDLFAPAVAIGMAIGRVGCQLTELPGTPTDLPWGIALTGDQAARVGAEAGAALHPSFGYEIVFHLVAFGVLWWWLRFQPIAAGETLTLYLAAYAVFRFLVEFVRGNETVFADLTRPQLFLLALLPLLLARIVLQARRGSYSLRPQQVPR